MFGKEKEEKEVVDDSEEYDPHLHREVAHPTTNFETLAHMIKCLIGTGILAMPIAFKNAGLLLGAVVMLLVAALVTYAICILVRAQYVLCKKKKVPSMTMSEALKYGLEIGPPSLKKFEKILPPCVDTLIILYQFGICSVYVAFVAATVVKMTTYYFSVHWNVRVVMLVIAALLVAMIMIRNLKLLAIFSVTANCLIILGLCFVIYFTLKHMSLPLDVSMFGPPLMYAQYYGTVLFALEPIGVIVALENNMSTPKNFLGYFGVLNIGMGVTSLLYCFIGIIGYISYKDEIKDSITLNIPEGEILGQIIVIAFGVIIFLSYALQFYFPVEIIWDSLVKPRVQESRHALYNRLLRVFFLILTMVVAVAVKSLGLLISLVGAVCLPFLGFSIPAILEYVSLWNTREKEKMWTMTVVKDIVVIVFGIVSMIIATAITVMDIVKEMQKPSS